jgi:hypothetical protein
MTTLFPEIHSVINWSQTPENKHFYDIKWKNPSSRPTRKGLIPDQSNIIDVTSSSFAII